MHDCRGNLVFALWRSAVFQECGAGGIVAGSLCPLSFCPNRNVQNCTEGQTNRWAAEKFLVLLSWLVGTNVCEKSRCCKLQQIKQNKFESLEFVLAPGFNPCYFIGTVSIKVGRATIISGTTAPLFLLTHCMHNWFFETKGLKDEFFWNLSQLLNNIWALSLDQLTK